jgi:DNA-3-methyladenine glycosylase I
MSDDDIFALLSNDGLIRNKLKLFSIRNNAISFQKIQKNFGSFDNYIWSYTNDKIIQSKDKNALDSSFKLLLSNNISKVYRSKNLLRLLAGYRYNKRP